MLTVTTAASDRTLLTLAEIKAAVGGNPANEDMAALNLRVAASLARACAIPAAGTTPPTFRAETITEVVRGACGEYIWMSRHPVVSITSVDVDGTTVDSGDYEIDGRRLYRLTSDARTYWYGKKITIVYVAGWATVPDDLKTAAVKFARILWAEDGTNAPEPGLKRERIEGVGEWERWVAPASDPLMSAEISELLAPYMNMQV